MKSAINGCVLALAATFAVAMTGQAVAQQKALKKYESGTKDFWTNPPPDWFLGDETEAQKGLAPPSGPPTGKSEAEISALRGRVEVLEEQAKELRDINTQLNNQLIKLGATPIVTGQGTRM